MAPNKLYVLPASHPSKTVEKALELKGVDFKRIDLIPGSHVALLKLRVGKRTAPAMVFDDGTKVSGSRAIVAELDRRYPEPRLGSDDTRVGAAEEWGDEVLQPLARRISWQALKRNRKAMPSYSVGYKLPIPVSIAKLGSAPVAAMEIAMNKASEENVRADLANLHVHLDRVDGWMEEGLLGGEQANAADLQIASSIALLSTFGDIRPIVEQHRAAELGRRWFGDFEGHTPAGALPAEWLPEPKVSASAA